MKKRRNLIISLLLIAAMVVGIGYAALAQELVISSTANLSKDDSDFKVEFISAQVSATTAASTEPNFADIATASVTGTSTTANYTITGLSEKNESVTLQFVVKNNSQGVEGKLTEIATIPGNLYLGEGTTNPQEVKTYFSKSIKVTYPDGTHAVVTTPVPSDPAKTESEDLTAQNIILEPGEQATIEITVTLLETIDDKLTLTGASVLLDFAGTTLITTP